MVSRKRLATIGIAIALVTAGLAWYFGQSSSAGPDRQVRQLENQQRINQRLIQMQASSGQDLATVSTTVATVLQNKDKLERTKATALKTVLGLYKIKIAVLKDQLDELEVDARKSLDGDNLSQVLTNIDGCRAYAHRLEVAHFEFDALVQQAFDTAGLDRDPRLERSIKEAYRMIGEALDKLEQDKDNGKAKGKPNP